MAEAVTRAPVLRAIRNPTPVRDLARGIAFEGLTRMARIIQDPEAKDGDAIKAMELVNGIESGQGGVIKAILVENGQPVEYGEPLFVIA